MIVGTTSILIIFLSNFWGDEFAPISRTSYIQYIITKIRILKNSSTCYMETRNFSLQMLTQIKMSRRRDGNNTVGIEMNIVRRHFVGPFLFVLLFY